jgi:3-hydroxyisobutyrate dehydrogenase-like beta-hydroxyacid dehydrogenase
VTAPTVGFIGLGQIGAPMAGRLTEWKGGLVVYDVVTDAMAKAVEAGATPAADVAAVGAAAQVISIMVRDDAQVRDVVAGLLTTAAPGTVIAVHSTIHAATAEELAPVCAAQGVHLLDVPVSGGFIGAYDGTLAAIVGGDREAYELVKAPFACWATLVVHVGPVGAGTRTKLARNLIQFAAYTAAYEAMRLAEAADIDLRKLSALVRHSDGVTGGAAAIMVRDTAGEMDPSDPFYEIFCHTRDLGEKDMGLALEMADSYGLAMPVSRLAYEQFARSIGVPRPT